MLKKLAIVLLFFSSLNAFGQLKHISFVTGEASEILGEKFYLLKAHDAPEDQVIRREGEFVIVKGEELTWQREVLEINDDWKLSSELHTSKVKKGFYYVKLYKDQVGLTDDLGSIRILKKVDEGLVIVQGGLKEIKKKLLPNKNVVFIQQANRVAKVESGIRQHDLSVNRINMVHHLYPELNGVGFQASVKENAFDTLDFDIAKRAVLDNQASDLVELHASEMATLIGGAGNTFINGKGVADQVGFFSADFASLMPEPNEYYSIRNITVQNHSYGIQIENFYGVESAAYDKLMSENQSLIHSFSIGNSGADKGTGSYDGINAFGTITGSFKQAKNILLVSSSDSLGQVSNLNSKGPAYDGRIKPDLVAFGGEGTSESAALVSGASILLQERYQNREGFLPSSHMIKSLLIAGTDDILEVGPDFTSGYGQLNLFQSLQILDSGRYIDSSVQQSQTQELAISIPSGIEEATFVLAWNDVPANSGDNTALINDLDFSIETGGSTFLPWTLDPSPNEAALTSPATRSVDHLNNIEMVTIDNPTPGVYSLDVNGFSVEGDQSFSICYFLRETGSFLWTYPTDSDPMESNEKKNARWNTTIDGQGILEINYLDTNWEVLSSSVSLEAEFENIQFPDTSAFAKLRMNTLGGVFESDTFFISPSPNLKVDLNCTEDFILKWNKIDEAEYSIRKYANGGLEEIASTSDTFLILKKSDHPEVNFSVYPSRMGKEAFPSILLNIEQQGVGCYFSNFLVTLNSENNADLRINLSGITLIKELKILKKVRGGESEIFQELQPTTSELFFQDETLEIGITSYQLMVITTDERQLFSSEISIFYTDDETYFNFPNPVTNGVFYFLSPETNTTLQLIDRQGKVVKEFDIVNEVEEIFVEEVSQGLYIYRVLKEGVVLANGKLIIR